MILLPMMLLFLCSISLAFSFAPPGYEIKGKYLPDSFEFISSEALTHKRIEDHESFAAWKKHFANNSESTESFRVPLEWVIFISSTLLTPDKFDWAKSFLKSTMWQIIKDGSSCKECITFYVPDTCPVSMAPICSQVSSQEELRHFSTP